jgi:hypothetical protein
MRRKIIIAQMLLYAAENKIKSVVHAYDNEDGFIYKITFENGKKNTVLIKPGSTIAVKVGDGDDEYETLELGVPHDIVQLLDNSEKKYHTSLKGYLKDSDAFREQLSKY